MTSVEAKIYDFYETFCINKYNKSSVCCRQLATGKLTLNIGSAPVFLWTFGVAVHAVHAKEQNRTEQPANLETLYDVIDLAYPPTPAVPESLVVCTSPELIAES